MYIRIYVHTYICKYGYMHHNIVNQLNMLLEYVCMCLRMYVRTNLCMYVCVRMNVCNGVARCQKVGGHIDT